MGIQEMNHDERSDLIWMPVSDLHVDQEYQRSVQPENVTKLAKRWNQKAAGVIICALRDDNHVYVLDGWHRVSAMKELGITHALCYITLSSGQNDEAKSFVDLNTHMRVKVLEKFRARLIAREPVAIAIDNIIKNAGWERLSHSRSLRNAGQVACIATIEELYERDAGTLADTLTLLKETWPNEPKIGESDVIAAVFDLLRHRTYSGNPINRKLFTQKVGRAGKADLETLVRRGQRLAHETHTTVYTSIAREMGNRYNDRLLERNRIKMDD